MTPILAALALCTQSSAPTPFLVAVGLERPRAAHTDVWQVAEAPAPFAWMNAPSPVPDDVAPARLAGNDFQQLLERIAPSDEQPLTAARLPGVITDPGRWFYQQETTGGGLYKRKTKVELPAPSEVYMPYAGRNWKAYDKVSIPVPIPLPVAEQLFVWGQIDGSGDALNNYQTSLYGKTGIGVKWSLIAKSELQLRYATMFTYAEGGSPGRFNERAQPAFELVARLPLVGPLEIEYTGAALPALSRSDADQLRQELRLALPLRGDNELEFGARYRWDYAQETTPWVDRAQLFLGLRLRH